MDPIVTVPLRSPILDPATQDVLPAGKGGQILKGQTTTIPLDGLIIQSIIAKFMGTLEDWKPHLDTTSARGYNMLHFTPLQQRGESNSPYSIYDQLLFADDLFADPKSLSSEQRNAEIKKWLKRIKDEWGMLSMTDVVYNHTANNSDWLQDHPESGYNVINSPHLEPALELDLALYKFSNDLATYNLPTNVASEAELEQVFRVLENKVLPGLRLWEYYAIDVATDKKRFQKAWNAGGSAAVTKQVPQVTDEYVAKKSKANGKNGVTSSSKNGHVAIPSKPTQVPEMKLDADLGSLPRSEVLELFSSLCLPKKWRQLGSRYHAETDVQTAVRFMTKLTGKDIGSDGEEVTAQLASILDELNVDRYRMYDDDLKAIIENSRSRVKYQRLEEHGPRMGPCTPDAPLVDRMFTALPNNKRTAKHDPKSLFLANNGWIWNANPLEDFASADSRAYLRREVIAWGDCVKLRYGKDPEDSPFVWKHMTE